MHDMHVPSGKRLQFANWKITIVKFGTTLSTGPWLPVRYVKLPEGILCAMPFNQIPNTGWCIVLPNKLDLKNPSKNHQVRS